MCPLHAYFMSQPSNPQLLVTSCRQLSFRCVIAGPVQAVHFHMASGPILWACWAVRTCVLSVQHDLCQFQKGTSHSLQPSCHQKQWTISSSILRRSPSASKSTQRAVRTGQRLGQGGCVSRPGRGIGYQESWVHLDLYQQNPWHRSE